MSGQLKGASVVPYGSVPAADMVVVASKREYFAAQALQGILSSDSEIDFEDASCIAVGHADALISRLATAECKKENHEKTEEA